MTNVDFLVSSYLHATFRLTLESTTRMDEYRRRAMSYFIDVPRLVLKPVAELSMYTSDTVYIAPGSRFLMLSFLYSDQVRK